MGAPFFIVGASRSGTTMMRLLLNAHPHVGVPKELAYFERCAREGHLDNWAKLNLSSDTYRTFVRGFLQRKKLALEGLDLTALENEIVTDGPQNLERPLRVTMDAWAAKEGKVTWGEKTPKNLFYVDLIHKIMPDARFIYIVRDPRAVAYSMNRFARFVDDSVLNAFNWLQAATTGYDLLSRSIPEAQRLVLKYEELVSDVEATTRKICTFLGEPFDEQMLTFYQQTQGNIHPHSKELGGVHTLTKPISTVSVDKWRDQMPAREVALVEAVCGDAMSRLGYERTDHQLGIKDRAMVRAKLGYCNWQQRRNRHLRAYQIAFKPFEKTKSRLSRLISRG